MNIEEIGIDGIDQIEELWQKLRDLHARESPHFKEPFQSMKFKDRCSKFRELSDDQLYILTAQDEIKTIGYCIATAMNGLGEIDSLYLDESHRGHGLGEELMNQAMAWLESKECTKYQVSVAVGHEYVFPFYEKFGFKPRLVYLEKQQ